jgi:fructose-1-phosphate kinase PfkB-like protein
MPAIITVTFSPCIDKSTSVSALIPEKKLKCTAPKLESGGGGINVARAIKNLEEKQWVATQENFSMNYYKKKAYPLFS